MTLALLLGYLALHGLFTWARVAVFRIDGPTPPGVRVIELAASAAIIVGAVLIAWRDGGRPALDGLAWLLAALSAALFLWALRCIRPLQLTAAFSTDTPHSLVTSGPFRWVRNPFYLSYLLAHAVPLAATGSAWAAPGLMLMAAIYRRAALLEEGKFLASPLAGPFRAYQRRTGRFLPRIGVRAEG